MVEAETFSRRLDALHGYLARLRDLGESDQREYLAEAAIHDLAARYLHLAVEAALDIANQWIAERGLRTPESNRDTFTVLEEAGEIPPALADRLRGWAGFRNVLVREYVNVDHRIGYAAIREELGDLDEFGRWGIGKLGAEGADGGGLEAPASP